MNKKILVVIGVLVVMVLILAAYMSSEAEKKAVMNDKVMMENEVDMMDGDTSAMMKGSYEAYSSEKVAWAETDDVVIFFHASWCPSCRGLSADIEKNIGVIPGGVHILKADYDTETELKKKYGVTYQHTLVQVDKDGNLIKKWSGSPSLSSLVAQIN